MDVKKATDMLRNTLKWRKDNKVDSILDNPPPKKNIATYQLHKEDKEGRVIVCGIYGRVLPVIPHLMTLEEFTRVVIWQCELIEQTLRKLSKRHGKRISRIVMLIDLSGLNTAVLKGRKYNNLTVELPLTHYPERLERSFFFNCPWFINALWKLAKATVDPTTLSKLSIHQDTPTEQFLEFIDKEKLPKIFGGDCDCKDKEGGCVPVPEEVSRPLPETDLTELTINAGERHEREIVIEDAAGGSVIWYFTSSNNIDFSATFAPKSGDSEEHAHKEERVAKEVPVSGSYQATSAGVCKFVWSNEFSVFRTKTIKMVVHKMKSDGRIDVDSGSED